MSEILAALVGVLALFCAANMALSFAIVRRLKAAEAAGVFHPAGDDLPEIGTVLGPLSVTTVDGLTLTDRDLAGTETFVALVQPGCGPCASFVDDVAQGHVRLPANALALVAAREPVEADSHVAKLMPHMRVAVVAHQGPEIDAFGRVGAYPTFLRLDHGVIAAVDYRAGRVLETLARAAK